MGAERRKSDGIKPGNFSVDKAARRGSPRAEWPCIQHWWFSRSFALPIAERFGVSSLRGNRRSGRCDTREVGKGSAARRLFAHAPFESTSDRNNVFDRKSICAKRPAHRAGWRLDHLSRHHERDEIERSGISRDRTKSRRRRPDGIGGARRPHATGIVHDFAIEGIF